MTKLRLSDDPAVQASLRKFGISEEQLLPIEDRAYNFMVKFCQEEGSLPTPGQIAKGIDSASITKVIGKLVNQGRVVKIGLGMYVPIVEGD